MSNAVYHKGLKNLWNGAINYPSNTIKIALLDATPTYDSTDEFLSEVDAGSHIVATSSALSSKTVSTTTGAVDAADVTFTALTGSAVRAWVMFKDTGSSSTSPVLCWCDTRADSSPLNYTPNGSDFTLQFGAGGIMTI